MGNSQFPFVALGNELSSVGQARRETLPDEVIVDCLDGVLVHLLLQLVTLRGAAVKCSSTCLAINVLCSILTFIENIKMKETHETYRLNELLPEWSCQLTSCDQHERHTVGTRSRNHHESRVGRRKSQIVLHGRYRSIQF